MAVGAQLTAVLSQAHVRHEVSLAYLGYTGGGGMGAGMVESTVRAGVVWDPCFLLPSWRV